MVNLQALPCDEAGPAISLLCLVHALRVYLERTESFRCTFIPEVITFAFFVHVSSLCYVCDVMQLLLSVVVSAVVFSSFRIGPGHNEKLLVVGPEKRPGL